MAEPKELIIPTFTQWEKVGSITNILAELQQGVFYDAALLVDQFMRDDRLRGVWDVAIQAVLGLPMRMESADHTAKKRSDKVSDQATKLWPVMAPRAELVELAMWGFFIGCGIARRNWIRTETSWTPTIQTWHSAALRYDLPTDMYMLRTQDQGEIPIRRDDPNWVLFTPWGYKYGRLRSYLMSAAMVTLERSWSRRDRARHSERHGLQFAQLIVPAESDQKDKDTARKAAAALGTETVSITPQGDKGNLFDWKFHEPAKSSSEVFGGTIQEIGESMAILILGQQMSTTGSTGLGSDKNPGDTVRRDKVRFYAECISDVGQDGILRPWASENFKGDEGIAPRPVIEVDPPEDENETAMADLAIANTLNAFKLAGAPLDQRKYLEARGYGDYLMTEDEHAAAKQKAMEEAQQNAKAMADTAPDDKKPSGKSAPTGADA